LNRVTDAASTASAYVYGREEEVVPKVNMLTRDEAQRLARAIARLPELLK
jgi:hypothetical protein